MSILNEIVHILKKQKQICRVILFGSRASNSYREDSDYDLCIIIKKEDIRKEIIFKLGEYMIKNNILIHPFILTEKEYEYKKDISTYKQEIFDNGIILI
ncbi:nucleotidyltransferase domain-containing protein [Clostridium butyricum]|uniref:nucleotidyltransferase domain-containing protein n=1 Tax=Clostridium butyricum TaxID=1492 RepID=UPI0018A907A6|nr:nucleotidyltransferase domain-containing protein [Clostridium butyricum]